MKYLKKYNDILFFVFFFMTIFGILYFIGKVDKVPVNSLKTEVVGNLLKINQINKKDVSYLNIYINKNNTNIEKNCFVKKPYLDKLYIDPFLFCKNEVFYCENKIIKKEFLPNQELTVQEALSKHNLDFTLELNRDAFLIHFWGYNKGKTIFLLILILTFVFYMFIRKGSVLFIGIVFAFLTGSVVGIINIKSDKDPGEVFYKKIEKMTGEKIKRNFDFF